MNDIDNIKVASVVVKPPKECVNKSPPMCRICRKETPIPSCEISMALQIFEKQKANCRGD